MLAMANKNGFVFGSPPGLANRARVPVDAVREALRKFQEPDPDSRTKDFEGRRIEVIDGGWRLLNYAKHRAIRDEEDRKMYMREYMREYRKPDVNNNVNKVSRRKPQLAQAEAEADTEEPKSFSLRSDKSGTRLPNGFKVSQEIRTWALENKCPDPDLHIAEFIDYWTAIPGQRGVKLDWNATFRNWLRKAAERTQVRDSHKTSAQLRNERNSALIDRIFAEEPTLEGLSTDVRQGSR